MKIMYIIVSLAIANINSFSAFADDSTAKVYRVISIKNVYDGDTFRAYLPGYEQDQRIRVRDVDTPEMRGQCTSETKAAIEARDFVRHHLQTANSITLTDIGRDKYQRILASVDVDGADLAHTLIKNNLGRKWRGKRESWCD